MQSLAPRHYRAVHYEASGHQPPERGVLRARTSTRYEPVHQGSLIPLPQLLQDASGQHHFHRADRAKSPGYSHIPSEAQQGVGVVW